MCGPPICPVHPPSTGSSREVWTSHMPSWQGDLLFVLTDRSPSGTIARQINSRTERLWNKLYHRQSLKTDLRDQHLAIACLLKGVSMAGRKDQWAFPFRAGLSGKLAGMERVENKCQQKVLCSFLFWQFHTCIGCVVTIFAPFTLSYALLPPDDPSSPPHTLRSYTCTATQVFCRQPWLLYVHVTTSIWVRPP